jgi:hypothetical protein
LKKDRKEEGSNTCLTRPAGCEEEEEVVFSFQEALLNLRWSGLSGGFAVADTNAAIAADFDVSANVGASRLLVCDAIVEFATGSASFYGV